MSTLGIGLDKYIDSVINVWNAGFRFRCKTINEFAMAIIQNHKFCADSSIGGSQHGGVSWREVNRLDSMHVIISKKYCEVHIDSVSVVAGRDAKTRKCNYNYGTVLNHLMIDLKRWPVILPSNKQGLVIGFRF